MLSFTWQKNREEIVSVIKLAMGAFLGVVLGSTLYAKEPLTQIGGALKISYFQQNSLVNLDADLVIEKNLLESEAFAVVGRERISLRGAVAEKLIQLYSGQASLNSGEYLTTGEMYLGYRQQFTVKKIILSLDRLKQIISAYVRLELLKWSNNTSGQIMRVGEIETDLDKLHLRARVESELKLNYRVADFGSGPEPIIVLRELAAAKASLIVPAHLDHAEIGGIYLVKNAFIGLVTADQFDALAILASRHKSTDQTRKRMAALAIWENGLLVQNPLRLKTSAYNPEMLSLELVRLGQSLMDAKTLAAVIDCSGI